MISRTRYSSKDISPEFKKSLEIVINIVNYIRTRPLKAMMFAWLFGGMGPEHTSLIFHCESRCVLGVGFTSSVWTDR